jgi:hypothetical protein
MSTKKLNNDLGKNLLNRFKAEKTFELDLGAGDVIKFQAPGGFKEYTDILDSVKTIASEIGADEDKGIALLLGRFITNLNEVEIEAIVREAPVLTQNILGFIENKLGDPVARVTAEAIEESKKNSKTTSSTD